MKLSDILTEDTIKLELTSISKEGIIEELIDILDRNKLLEDRDTALRDVLARESKESTGLEGGVAVPHAKSAAVKSLVIAIAISREGKDFDSLDGKPVHIFFIFISPPHATKLHLQVLAEIARITKNGELCEKLRKTSSAREVLNIIREEEGKLN